MARSRERVIVDALNAALDAPPLAPQEGETFLEAHVRGVLMAAHSVGASLSTLTVFAEGEALKAVMDAAWKQVYGIEVEFDSPVESLGDDAYELVVEVGLGMIDARLHASLGFTREMSGQEREIRWTLQRRDGMDPQKAREISQMAGR